MASRIGSSCHWAVNLAAVERVDGGEDAEQFDGKKFLSGVVELLNIMHTAIFEDRLVVNNVTFKLVPKLYLNSGHRVEVVFDAFGDFVESSEGAIEAS